MSLPPTPQTQQPDKATRIDQLAFGVFFALVFYCIGWFRCVFHDLAFVDRVLFPEPRDYSRPSPFGIMALAWASEFLFPATANFVLALALWRFKPFASRGLLIGSLLAIVLDIVYISWCRAGGW